MEGRSIAGRGGPRPPARPPAELLRCASVPCLIPPCALRLVVPRYTAVAVRGALLTACLGRGQVDAAIARHRQDAARDVGALAAAQTKIAAERAAATAAAEANLAAMAEKLAALEGASRALAPPARDAYAEAKTWPYEEAKSALRPSPRKVRPAQRGLDRHSVARAELL